MEKKNNPTNGEALPKNVIIATIPKHDEVKPAKELPKAEEIKKSLDEQIKKFNQLNSLVNNRLIFLQKKEQLLNYLEQVNKEITGTDLESKVCKMVLSEPNTYRNEGITISNSLVIEKALRFVIVEIEEKVKIIESEILTIS